MRVFLVGFMGSGKTNSGRVLARLLQTLFWDLDGRVEAMARMSVADIFREQGEAAFRAAETRQLAGLARHASAVVATGGGTFVTAGQPGGSSAGVADRCSSMSRGRSCCAACPASRAIAARSGSLRAGRLGLWRARLPHYRQADYCVQPRPDEDAEAVARRIALLLGGAR